MSSRPTSDELNKEHNWDCVCSLSLAPSPGDWSQWQNIGSHKETGEKRYGNSKSPKPGSLKEYWSSELLHEESVPWFDTFRKHCVIHTIHIGNTLIIF